ncbi:MAG: hypothetical protein QNJ97_23030 [Myxococcota bacterium]|nr:hypothetical protein [Myxococcota bacterium]
MRKRVAISLATAVMGLLIVSAAQAKKKKPALKCPPIPEDTTAASDVAGELFDLGEQFLERRRFEAAVTKFLCSAKAKDHINTTLNIAQAARYIKKKKRLLKLFRQFMEENPGTITSRALGKLTEIIEGEMPKNRRSR